MHDDPAKPATAATAKPAAAGSASRDDAVSALINLGYHETHARQAVATVLRDKGSDAGLNDIIRLSLKELAP